MIILYNQSDINKAAAEVVRHNNDLAMETAVFPSVPASINSSNCYVINLDNTKLISVTEFAAYLIPIIKKNSITHIYLIMNENIHDHSIIYYATQLAKHLNNELEQPVEVHNISEINHDETRIEPILETHSWKIRGVDKSEKGDQQKIIWEGKDLHEWMNDPQRSFSGITYVWAR